MQHVTKWFRDNPDIFDSLITKTVRINPLTSYRLEGLYDEMVKIIKTFNIASIEPTIPNPNAAIGTEGIEKSNTDNSVVSSDSVNSDNK